MAKPQPIPSKPVEAAIPKVEVVPEPPVTVRVKALWPRVMRGKLLVQSPDGLYLLPTTEWSGEREFDVVEADLSPIPRWDKLADQVRAEEINRIMARNGLIDKESLRDPRLVAGAVQELASTFAVALQQE